MENDDDDACVFISCFVRDFEKTSALLSSVAKTNSLY